MARTRHFLSCHARLGKKITLHLVTELSLVIFILREFLFYSIHAR